MKKLRSAAPIIAADLPIDVIPCILSHLPVKSVLRFKCVSKSWRSLISHPHFKRLHLLHSHNSANQVFVLRNPAMHYSFCDATFFDDLISEHSTQIQLPFRRHLRLCDGVIVCSCDGLLLLRDLYGQLILLNPSTEEQRKLPKVENYYSDSISDGYDLGYDSSSDDYKLLLRRLRFNPVITRNIMILSLKTNCWRKVKDFRHNPNTKNAINLNGFLNWLQNSSARGKIVCFSLANETTTEMEHPRRYSNYGHGLRSLGVLQGCLCLTETRRAAQSIAQSMTVWIMKEFGVTSSWMKLITVPQRPGDYAMDLTIPLPLHHISKIVFLIDDTSRAAAHMLLIIDLEAQNYRFIKIANVQKYMLLTGLTFSRSLISPN
ncbi:F-box/kelch-repeat protein At3g23880-like [Mercurialis annua]|uniref:F-box/kelch-repeat protein At3g23880-like n=1 Tax=Mercurialis annua TaxID=3986 RepID=UPI00215ED236|nr:F-box/kelch-repeat protein At3g23880-like [Mercurialis annua]